jgi:hypothetical protein
MRLKLIANVIILLIFGMDLLYQFVRVDRSLSDVLDHLRKSDSIADSITELGFSKFVNDSIVFSGGQLEMLQHMRSGVMFQMLLLVLLVLLQIDWRRNWRKSSTEEAGL